MTGPTTGDLGENGEAAVSALVRSGRYASRSDVLREGVRLVEEREARLLIIDEALEQGLRDAGAGRVKRLDDVVRRLAVKWGDSSAASAP